MQSPTTPAPLLAEGMDRVHDVYNVPLGYPAPWAVLGGGHES